MMTEDRVHNRFGGSNADRWLACPGSVRLSESVPPQPENPHMRAGTHAHALLEGALREQSTDVAELEGEVLLPGHEPLGLDDVEAVQVALDAVYKILSLDRDAQIWVERMSEVRPGVGGTADVVIYLPGIKRLVVIDYKHGAGHFVKVEDNPQIKLYMLGVLVNFERGLQVDDVQGMIIQPRNNAGPAVRSVVYTPADLIDFYGEVDAAVANAASDNPTYAAGPHCKWCPAAHICPLLVGSAAQQLTAWKPPTGETITLTLPAAHLCTDPAMLAEAKRVGTQLRAWLDALDDNAYALAMAGTDIPGFKLVDKRPSRKWIEEVAAGRVMMDVGLTLDEVMPRKLLTVAQAEKIVKAKAGAAGVAKLAEVVNKESSGLNLVPIEAKGDAVHPLKLAAAGFGEITD